MFFHGHKIESVKVIKFYGEERYDGWERICFTKNIRFMKPLKITDNGVLLLAFCEFVNW